MAVRLDPDRAISGLREGRFLVVGRAGMDLYPDPPGTKIAEATTFKADLGGSAGNIVVAIARHGKAAALVSVLSHDAVGRFTAARLATYGVATDCIAYADGVDQAMVRNSLALAESVPVDAEVVIYRNNASDMCLSVAHVASLGLDDVAGVVITGTALSDAPSDAALAYLADAARGAGKPVILDIDYRISAWPSADSAAQASLNFAQQCDMVVGNDSEFALLASALEDDDVRGDSVRGDSVWGDGIRGDGVGGLALAQKMAEQGRVVIYKQGEHGCQLLQGTHRQQFGIYPVEIAKPFGAGDAFLGTLLARMQDGVSLAAALADGSAAAALVVSRVGCASAMPDAAELAAFIASHESN